MKNKKEKKGKIICFRITDKQLKYIDFIINEFKQKTGVSLTRTSIILKLMELGYVKLQEDFLSTHKENKKSA